MTPASTSIMGQWVINKFSLKGVTMKPPKGKKVKLTHTLELGNWILMQYFAYFLNVVFTHIETRMKNGFLIDISHFWSCTYDQHYSTKYTCVFLRGAIRFSHMYEFIVFWYEFIGFVYCLIIFRVHKWNTIEYIIIIIAAKEQKKFILIHCYFSKSKTQIIRDHAYFLSYQKWIKVKG